MNFVDIGVPCDGLPCPTRRRCPDMLGCPPDACPDFTIKQHSTMPLLNVSVEGCDDRPLLATDPDQVVEVNMWAEGRLKVALAQSDTSFQFADNVGYWQCDVGDTLLLEHPRSPEYLTVTGFDEVTYTVSVTRGVAGTAARAWPRGSSVRMFRVLSQPASIVTMTADIPQEDGTVHTNEVIGTSLVYAWTPSDTCLPGCYWLEFKLLYMPTTSIVPFSTSANCSIGAGVQWARRFPESSKGFLVRVLGSPTGEI